ncbi:hypothetical protein Q5424_08925 [Conexibacter sp. JD483]|uniref:hypothetical protein n=1 Tax=unclassified Conexibacter TaxID=2627773 RepID=UPI00271E02A5|nr:MULTISPECIES: hypothetical protein [unclassified Conexibacter]MDO8186380.1 hypothetical protein [Conexibacter sp. CPCC 205706]MDO8199779.1 hypothetical protein [Conexibacter sp. CPCC 205762]MDR9369201.1 hypothetical protein [Conexibacter sp. JD483]
MTSTTKKRAAAVAVGAVGAGLVARRALTSDQVRFARMGGSSIAAPDAAGWVTDFLNAAYYAKPAGQRDPEDLRLAFAIVTTRWQRGGRRLHAHDVLAFHRAFGRRRFNAAERGTLDRAQLLAGGAKLFGDWFAAAWADDARRGWGVVFETEAEKAAYVPEKRLELAKLGELTPAAKPQAEQVWHTYDPVAVPDADAIVDVLTRPERWPDYGTAIGRFTPLRSGGLAGQTFEIEVAAQPAEKTPVYTRGYVTITRLVTHADPEPLAAYMAELNEGMARIGRDEPQPLPDGATPLVGFDLTTHAGHFMGAGNNRLLLYVQDGQAYVRAAGTWDDMPWHLDQAYRLAGADAQAAFWGEGDPQESMLHQLALKTGPR